MWTLVLIGTVAWTAAGLVGAVGLSRAIRLADLHDRRPSAAGRSVATDGLVVAR